MRRAFHAVLALFLLNGVLFGSWAARIPAFKSEFTLGPDTLGLILLCLAAGAIVAFPMAGRLIDTHGPEGLGKGLAVAYLAALPLLALAPSAVLLGVALAYFGACFGAMDVAMNAWGAEVETARARPLLPQMHAVFSLGAGLGAAGGALAVLLGLGPLAHFALASGLMAIAALPVIMRGVPARATCPAPALVTSPSSAAPPMSAPPMSAPPMSAAPESPPPVSAPPVSARTILPRGALLLVGLVAAAAGLSEAAVADWSAVYLSVVTLASPAMAALGFAAFSITMVIVRLSGGRLVSWLGAVTATRVSGLLLATGAALTVLASSTTMGLAGFAVLGCGAALVMPLAFARASADPHVPPGTAIAQVALVGYGGMLLGPPLIGFLAAYVGYPGSFVLLILLGMLVAALASSLRAHP